ncbi:TIM-barrel domain-containing protein [Lactobacillus acetotolerans]|jgi:alpha-glucosidase (family GH31 glycosyl hydrolase)|uniref:TIM-barrel domain-containing protein n=1 Tax=Lactobacillus acetotolerans TaxID=1600 RepID=UPI000E9E7AC4|nr:TIM-barrel domain-containing protein [Lactobacillus acetotolerans]HBG90797.1 alpha-glucosidase [Lactobacillus acetotolerans]HCX39531.1 alpha-glucosidase [Lactobacillus acetotolerans]
MTQDTQMNKHQLGQLIGANRRDHYYELHYATGEVARFYILGDGIFRYFLDPDKNFNENHTSFVDLSRFDNHFFEKSSARATSDSLIIQSGIYQIIFQQKPALMSIFDENLHRTRMTQIAPIELDKDQTTEFLKQNKNEFYFGGGMQNGYFSHKGRRINIKRDKITGKDGVLTQVPFFWSNAGFGELRNTVRAGSYDFGKSDKSVTALTHTSKVFDNFYIIGNSPTVILDKYYLLTGKPLMLPKYALGLGHIGNFITTMWQPSQAKKRNASRFDNNSYYTRTNDPKKVSGKASLNGEEEYQFSARAMIDRYQKLHFPLSWFVPNYGVQDVDQDSLATFNDYANNQDIHAGFWSNQAVTEPSPKTAFIMTNTSFSKVLDKDQQSLKTNLKRKRPLILTNTGTAGSQNKTALAFGDTGGNWENIPTQIASFLGSSLSGQPIVGAAIDGTNGGGNAQISIRDFEWKAFTPLFFNIDDQGTFSKTPFAYNSKMTQINRAYLQLRNQLKNYLYTLIYKAQTGDPILRALFIEFPHEQVNYTSQVGNEFMLGPNLLISPITNGREDSNGNSRKDNLYLPSHRTMWIDLFTGKRYLGGRVFNKLSYPLWHLPVFIRGGAIFDLGNRNYILYPQGRSEITTYDDNDFNDFNHNHTETKITSDFESSRLTVTIDPVKGDFNGMKTNNSTNLNIMCDSYPDRVTVRINDQTINMQEYGTPDTFSHAKEGFFYNTDYTWLPEFNQYQKEKQTALQIKLASRDITDSKIEVIIQNFNYGNQTLVHSITDSLLRAPKLPTVDPTKITAHSFELAWPQVSNQVQVEINGLLYDGIDGTSFTFHELTPNSRYIIRLRYVAGNKVSEWSDYFGVITKRAAIDYAINNIHVQSNLDSNKDHPLNYLTDLKLASEWETNESVSENKPLQLTFTFDELEKLSRMTYVPRNVDHKGDPTSVGIEISSDGEKFASYGDRLTWKADSKNKVVGLRDVTAKAIRLTIYKSSGPIVAGREVMFFRAKK